MAASDAWYEFHLTPTGWIAGDEALDATSRVRRTVPAERVLTVRRREFAPSESAPLVKSDRIVWTCGDGALIAALEAQFPREF